MYLIDDEVEETLKDYQQHHVTDPSTNSAQVCVCHGGTTFALPIDALLITNNLPL
jgi:hypothetical protein